MQPYENLRSAISDLQFPELRVVLYGCLVVTFGTVRVTTQDVFTNPGIVNRAK